MHRFDLEAAKYETSIASWSFALADALNSYGIDAAPLFLEAGIDLSSVTSPATRLPVASVQQVWRYAEQHTDAYFGSRVAQFLTPASLHALGFGLMCSTTLKDYFERYIRYRCVLSHMHFCELIQDEHGFRLSLVDEREVKSEVTQDAAICYFLRMARVLHSPGFAPSAIHVTRSMAPGENPFRDFEGTITEGGAGSYQVLLDNTVMDIKLRFANNVLAKQQDALVERYIAENGLISEYMLRVRTGISQLLDMGSVTIETVAANLNVTVRTLQRRLADESSSYHILLDEARKALALELIRDQQLTATEAAYRLGFNDSGSFGRSFKRWTGQTFTRYRAAFLKARTL